jgi:SAM-dependent methyltransferase
VTHTFVDYCLCPRCRSAIRQTPRSLLCTYCGAEYEIRHGIPMLLPAYENSRQARYFDCYQAIAKDDLAQPIEKQRGARHAVLKNFIGDVANKKVLDIGSSHALYLRNMNAGLRVALDLAVPYLLAIPETDSVVRICGDAEYLPLRLEFFDVIIVSDILEHLLNPERLVQLLRATCRRDTRVIVHVPWEEDIGHYREAKYEFTHLRTFDMFTFMQLWQGFSIKRDRATFPSIDRPIFFTLQGRIPRVVFNMLAQVYFETDLWKREHEWRLKWLNELPKGERWLLRFYNPTYQIFELRTLKRSPWAYAFWKIRQGLRLLHARGESAEPNE